MICINKLKEYINLGLTGENYPIKNQSDSLIKDILNIMNLIQRWDFMVQDIYIHPSHKSEIEKLENLEKSYIWNHDDIKEYHFLYGTTIHFEHNMPIEYILAASSQIDEYDVGSSKHIALGRVPQKNLIDDREKSKLEFFQNSFLKAAKGNYSKLVEEIYKGLQIPKEYLTSK